VPEPVVVAMVKSEKSDDDKLPEPPEPLPMEKAPIEPGVEYGPCLIYSRERPHRFTNWRIGMWSGSEWYLFGTGIIVEPIAWSLLPQIPMW
jgi:hypothetical protein